MHQVTADELDMRPIDRVSTDDTIEPGHKIRLSAARVGLALAAVALVLVGLGIAGQVARWQFGIVNNVIVMFDLEAEKNAPTLFSGFIMLVAAAVVWAIQRLETNLPIRRKWQVLGAGMLLMAIDEVFRIHERPTDLIRAWLGNGDLGMFTYAWVIPALVILPFIGWYFLSFLKTIPWATASGFVAAGALFVGGSVGLEMVGGWYAAQHGIDGMLSFIAIIEEACEFAGICLFIYVALRHLAEYVEWAEVRFGR